MPNQPVSNGYVIGYLCGYLGGNVSPALLGYNRGYLSKQAASECPMEGDDWVSKEEIDEQKKDDKETVAGEAPEPKAESKAEGEDKKEETDEE